MSNMESFAKLPSKRSSTGDSMKSLTISGGMLGWSFGGVNSGVESHNFKESPQRKVLKEHSSHVKCSSCARRSSTALSISHLDFVDPFPYPIPFDAWRFVEEERFQLERPFRCSVVEGFWPAPGFCWQQSSISLMIRERIPRRINSCLSEELTSDRIWIACSIFLIWQGLENRVASLFAKSSIFSTSWGGGPVVPNTALPIARTASFEP